MCIRVRNLTHVDCGKSFRVVDFDSKVCSLLLQSFSLVFDWLVVLVLLGGYREAQREHHTAEVHEHGAVGGVDLLDVVRRLEDSITGMLLSFSFMQGVEALDFGQAGEHVCYVDEGEDVHQLEAVA